MVKGLIAFSRHLNSVLDFTIPFSYWLDKSQEGNLTNIHFSKRYLFQAHFTSNSLSVTICLLYFVFFFLSPFSLAPWQSKLSFILDYSDATRRLGCYPLDANLLCAPISY